MARRLRLAYLIENAPAVNANSLPPAGQALIVAVRVAADMDSVVQSDEFFKAAEAVLRLGIGDFKPTLCLYFADKLRRKVAEVSVTGD